VSRLVIIDSPLALVVIATSSLSDAFGIVVERRCDDAAIGIDCAGLDLVHNAIAN